MENFKFAFCLSHPERRATRAENGENMQIGEEEWKGEWHLQSIVIKINPKCLQRAQEILTATFFLKALHVCFEAMATTIAPLDLFIKKEGETFSIHSHFNSGLADVLPRKRDFCCSSPPIPRRVSKKTIQLYLGFGIKDRIINSLLIAREMVLMSEEGEEQPELSFLK